MITVQNIHKKTIKEERWPQQVHIATDSFSRKLFKNTSLLVKSKEMTGRSQTLPWWLHCKHFSIYVFPKII
jgi:hypothetical protein